MHYRDNEWLNENELMMYSDSECETYTSSYEDESVESEDLNEYSMQKTEEKLEDLDDEERCDLVNNFIDDEDTYTPLNDLLKVNNDLLASL